MTDNAGDNWRRILEISPNTWLGVTNYSDRIWIGSFESPKHEVDLANPIGVLPLLERAHSVVQAEIEDAEESAKLERGFIEQKLPVSMIVKTAFRSQSDYWASRAVVWAAEMGRTGTLLLDVKDLQDALWASQTTRHDAKRLAKRWEQDAS